MQLWGITSHFTTIPLHGMATNLVSVHFAAWKKIRMRFKNHVPHIICMYSVTNEQYKKCNICSVTFFKFEIMHPAAITVSLWNFRHPISVFVFFPQFETSSGKKLGNHFRTAFGSKINWMKKQIKQCWHWTLKSGSSMVMPYTAVVTELTGLLFPRTCGQLQI